MMKFLRVLKIIGIVLLLGAALYLFVLKGEKKSSSQQTTDKTQETEIKQETNLLGKDGTYNFEDEKLAVSVNLPSENIEYADAVQTYGEEQIQRFVSSRGELENIDSASFPWNLDMDYKKYESKTIVSYVVQGYEYTGGAHGNSFTKSFNFDKKTGKQITIENIVASKDTFNSLSSLADKNLSVEYSEGADARSENWSVWYADDTSVTFIFVPYQIAAYAAGQQELKVDVAENRNLFQEKYFQ